MKWLKDKTAKSKIFGFLMFNLGIYGTPIFSHLYSFIEPYSKNIFSFICTTGMYIFLVNINSTSN